MAFRERRNGELRRHIKKFIFEKRSKTIKEKFYLNNSNFSLNKSNTFFNIIIDVKYNKEIESGFEFVDISIE